MGLKPLQMGLIIKETFIMIFQMEMVKKDSKMGLLMKEFSRMEFFMDKVK